MALRVRLRRALRLGRSWSERRFHASITEYRTQLERRITALSATTDPDPPWKQTAQHLLASAQAALDSGDLDTAYACLLGAQRTEVLGYDRHEVRAASAALTQEAAGEKIGGWRARAIEAILGEDSHDGDDGGPARLYQALLIRDESFMNDYRKIDRMRQQLFALGVALAAAVFGILAMAAWLPISTTETAPFGGRIAVYVALFGALGGSLTALISVIRSGTRSRIPQQLVQGSVVLVRPLFGAAAALGVYAFLQSGLLTVASNRNAAVLVASFVAGFTERFIAYAVGTVVPQRSGEQQT